MRKKKKPSGRPFKKGNKAAVGNPARRTKPDFDADERAALSLDKTTLTRNLILHTHLTIAELKAKSKNPNSTWIEAAICKIMLRINNSGDVYAFNALMDRTIGPVTQKVEVDRTNRYVSMSDDELLAEKKRLAALAEIRLRQIENQPQIYEKLLAQHARNVTPPPPPPPPTTPPQEATVAPIELDPGDIRSLASGE